MGLEVFFRTTKNPPLISVLSLLNALNTYTHRCVKVSWLRPLVLLIAIVLRRKWLRSSGGVILTVEDQSAWRKACRCAILSTTNPTWIEPGYNLFPLDYKPTNDVSCCSTTSKHRHFKLCIFFRFVPRRKLFVALIKH